MSTSGGAWRALQRGRGIRCDVVQLFVKNNMQWFGKPISPQDLSLYATERAANHFACVFGHAGYLINLGGPASGNRDRSIKSLIQEVSRGQLMRMSYRALQIIALAFGSARRCRRTG